MLGKVLFYPMSKQALLIIKYREGYNLLDLKTLELQYESEIDKSYLELLFNTRFHILYGDLNSYYNRSQKKANSFRVG